MAEQQHRKNVMTVGLGLGVKGKLSWQWWQTPQIDGDADENKSRLLQINKTHLDDVDVLFNLLKLLRSSLAAKNRGQSRYTSHTPVVKRSKKRKHIYCMRGRQTWRASSCAGCGSLPRACDEFRWLFEFLWGWPQDGCDRTCDKQLSTSTHALKWNAQKNKNKEHTWQDDCVSFQSRMWCLMQAPCPLLFWMPWSSAFCADCTWLLWWEFMSKRGNAEKNHYHETKNVLPME